MNKPTQLPSELMIEARNLANDLFLDLDNRNTITVDLANIICGLHAEKIAKALAQSEKRGYELGKRIEAHENIEYNIYVLQKVQGALSRIGHEKENLGEGEIVGSLQNAKNMINEQLRAEQIRKDPRYFYPETKNITLEEALSKPEDTVGESQ